MNTSAIDDEQLARAVAAAGGVGAGHARRAAIAAELGGFGRAGARDLDPRLWRAVADGVLEESDGAYRVRLPEHVLGVPRGRHGWLDLRGHDLRALVLNSGYGSEALHHLHFERVRFGDRDRLVEPADIERCSFKESSFRDTTFDRAALTDVYFRGCEFSKCLFRYVHAVETSFQDATFEDCDFYRAHFDAANIFTDASFVRVSLDKAWVAGMSGLTSDNFTCRWAFSDRSKSRIGVVREHRADRRNRAPMVQECTNSRYEAFLEMTASDRPDWDAISRALANAERDAAEVYRSLSGMWTGVGQGGYAGFAYRRCKTLERKFHNPIRRLRWNRQVAVWNRARRPLQERRRDARTLREERLRDSAPEPRVAIVRGHALRWGALFAAWALAGYGERMRRVAGWLVALIVAPAIFYSLFGGVRTDAEHPVAVSEFGRCLLFSVQQITASTHHLVPATRWVELVGGLQVLGGVTLLGLFGFTLANRLRNS